jgi:uncharacterized protein YuzE
VIRSPEQIVPDADDPNRQIRQSRFRDDQGREKLLRIVVEENKAGDVVSCFAVQTVLERRDMKLTYDKETDTLLIVLKSKAIDETEEIRPGVLADLDDTGALVSLEILNASRKVDTLKELLASHAPVELEMA